MSFHAAPARARRISTAALTALVGVHVVAAQQQPPLSLTTATTTALQQVSAFQQAQIDEALAAEDLRQARAALLPRARDSFSITYNTAERGSPAVLGGNFGGSLLERSLDGQTWVVEATWTGYFEYDDDLGYFTLRSNTYGPMRVTCNDTGTTYTLGSQNVYTGAVQVLRSF